MLSKLLENHLPVDVRKMRASDFLTSQERFELSKLKRIADGHGWKAVEYCPVCGSTSYETELEKYGIQLVRCTNCDLRFHTRISANPDDIYQASEYTVSTKDLEGDFEEQFRYRRERFGRERLRLLEKYCGDLSNKTLLDIGCGNGYFLSVASEVCRRCIGSEFSEHLRELSRKKTGLTIYNEPLESFPEKDIDIIVSFDVIEHVPQPVPFMLSARNLLSPEGYILLYTPNFDSFSARVMRERSPMVDGTEHVVLFNCASLKTLGEIAGLELVHWETHGLDIHNVIAYQSYLGEQVNPFLVKWLDELQAMIDVSGAADSIRVLYKKR